MTGRHRQRARRYLEADSGGAGEAHAARPDRADGAAQQYEGVRRAPRGYSTVEHYPPRYPLGRKRSEVAGTRHISVGIYCCALSFGMFCGAVQSRTPCLPNPRDDARLIQIRSYWCTVLALTAPSRSPAPFRSGGRGGWARCSRRSRYQSGQLIEADASRIKRVKGAEIDWTDAERARRPIREYFEALDGGNAPINPERAPKAMSPSDPCAAWTTRGRHKVMFGYSLNYLIDMENAVILDVEATPTRLSKEVDATKTMIDRTEDRFGLKPDRIAGDVAYGTGEMLGWLVERDITPHIPVRDKAKRDDGSLSRDDFCYDKERDAYLCPQEKPLKTTGRLHGGKTLLYRSSKYDCDGCPLKPRCCPTTPSRKVPRDINEDARDYARTLIQTEAYVDSSGGRKKIEALFGEAKNILSMVRLRLRGLSGARDEFLLTATVQNLKRLAAHAARPPPRPMMA